MDDDRSDLTKTVVSSMPFAELLGIHSVRGNARGLTARADWDASRCTVAGALHGGYLMSAADSIAATLAFLNLPEGSAGTTTIESKTNFFRAASQGSVTIESTVVHAGRTTIVVQTDILREDGKLLTRTTQTQAVLRS